MYDYRFKLSINYIVYSYYITFNTNVKKKFILYIIYFI